MSVHVRLYMKERCAKTVSTQVVFDMTMFPSVVFPLLCI